MLPFGCTICHKRLFVDVYIATGVVMDVAADVAIGLTLA
jgi:hypothetical protein